MSSIQGVQATSSATAAVAVEVRKPAQPAARETAAQEAQGGDTQAVRKLAQMQSVATALEPGNVNLLA